MSSSKNSHACQADSRPADNRSKAPDPAEIEYRPERADDAPAIEAITDRTFGPGRYVRAAERVRELFPVKPSLCLVATHAGEIVGSVRVSEIVVRAASVLMLGPLAVEPHLKGIGIGKTLLRRTAETARLEGYVAIYLVGDPPYYALAGYRTARPKEIALPRPVDPSRVLVLDLSANQTKR